MGKITEILNVAQQRGKDLNLPYAGAVTPQEAYELMRTAPGAKIVDVRTRAEIDWVGRVPGAVEIEWLSYPGMKQNPNFMAALEQQVEKEAMVLFLCRSAHRSHAAAMVATQAGYNTCFNILEGFEGDRNPSNQRNKLSGWRLAGLPWEQS
ncbi:MAG: rhodanese-like domain-containing protein [Nitrosomonadales bacterium]|nr:rhodanese-like domain-containing protein [Nitrosomonadales bacterium]